MGIHEKYPADTYTDGIFFGSNENKQILSCTFIIISDGFSRILLKNVVRTGQISDITNFSSDDDSDTKYFLHVHEKG